MIVLQVPAFLYFNPHSREGSDLDKYRFADDLWRFQSTLPRGE